MKKRIIISVCAVLVIVGLAFLVKSLFGPFYDKSYEITEQQIENRIAINKINNLVNQDYLAKTFSGNDYDEQFIKVKKAIDRDGVIEELKEARLIEAILKSENKALKYDDVKKTAEAELERVKTDKTSESYYNSLKKALKSENITEQEYLELSYDYAYDLYSKTAFNAWFAKSKHYKDNRDPNFKYANEYFDLDSQTEAFLEKELKGVKVVIK